MVFGSANFELGAQKIARTPQVAPNHDFPKTHRYYAILPPNTIPVDTYTLAARTRIAA